MRALWQRYGRTGIGVPEDALPALASEHAGHDLGDFFARYVMGTDDLPLAELLAAFGVTLGLRPSTGDDDRGGKPGKPASRNGGPRCWLGAKVAGTTEPRLQHVFTGGPAERAGLAGGDVVVAIDGLRASAESIRKLLAGRRPGDAVTVHAFRRDELIAAELVLEAAPPDTCWLTLVAPIDDATRERRDAWLGITPSPATE